MKNILKGKITTIATSFTMAFTVTAAMISSPSFATATFADENVSKGMILSSEKVVAGNYIYFGNFNEVPVKYQVLDDEGYLFSTDIMERIQYNYALKNAWTGSLAEKWCEETFYTNAFNSREKEAVVSVTKTDPAYTTTHAQYKSTNYISQDLVDNHVFFISAEEVEKYFPDLNDRTAQMKNGDRPNYWTRSRAWGAGALVGNVIQSNDTYNDTLLDDSEYTQVLVNLGIRHNLGARPALYLDRDDVLLMTVADGGKQSGAIGKDALVAMPDATGNDWKLTLNDPAATFKAEVVSEDNSKVVISYENAYAGENAYVSAIITDKSGAVAYYGHIAKDSLSGTQEINLPAEMPDGSYTLKVLAEVINGDQQTDWGKISLSHNIEKKTPESNDPVRESKSAVKTVAVKSVQLNVKNETVNIGETKKLKATVTPSNATNKAVTWKSSNNKIATVDKNGNVKGIKNGTVTITATTNDGKKVATAKVTIKPIAVKSVKLNLKNATVEVGKTKQFKATVTPSNATNKAVTWKSSNNKIATVDKNGKVKGIKKGTVTITATTNDGKKVATAKVTIKPIAVKSVKLNAKNATVKVGKTKQLKATVTPSNATNKAVTWKSSNNKIATVDKNGKVKGKKNGTATITAITKDGKKVAKCKIKVVK